MPETCCLYWSNDYVTNNWTASNNSIWVPTNFPTRRLNLVVNDLGLTNLLIRVDTRWAPSSEKEIDITVLRTSAEPTNRNTRITARDGALIVTYNTPNQYRAVNLSWDPIVGLYWQSLASTLAGRPFFLQSQYANFPDDWPSTVEEWIERYHGATD